MKQIKVHYLFWITALFYLIMSCFWYINDKSIDINIHDTYFVMEYFHVGLFNTQAFFISGLIYWLCSKFNLELKNALTNIHVFVTIGSVFAYFFGSYIYDSIYQNEFPLFDYQSKSNIYTLILIVLSVIAQIVFLINIIFSLINQYKKSK